MAHYQDPRSQKSRDALLVAARRLVAARPVDSLSVTEVAAEAGVSRPTFYQHFEDVAALTAAATALQMERIFADIDDQLQGDSLDYVRELLHLFVNAIYEDRDFSHNAMHSPAVMAIAVDTMRMLDAKMRDHVIGSKMAGSGQAADDRRSAISAGMVFMLFGWLDSDFTGQNEPDAMADRLADTLFDLAGVRE